MDRIEPIQPVSPVVIDLRDGARRRLGAWSELSKWAPPAPAELDAARALGVSTDATQADIDARFRQIVRAQRPDLGQMSAEALSQLLAARRVLSDRSRRLRRDATTGEYAPSGLRPGRVIDLTL